MKIDTKERKEIIRAHFEDEERIEIEISEDGVKIEDVWEETIGKIMLTWAEWNKVKNYIESMRSHLGL